MVNVQWFGTDALELPYKDPTGRVANVLLYRDDEPWLELVEQSQPWSFDRRQRRRPGRPCSLRSSKAWASGGAEWHDRQVF